MPARWLAPILSGMAVTLCGATLLMIGPDAWRETLRAGAEDRVMRWAYSGAPEVRPPVPVTVVEIDSAALEHVGSWPWPREELARLVHRIADAGPVALGLDLLLAGADSRSPVLELRRRGLPEKDPIVTAIEARLPDGDRALRAALARQPSALGIALDTRKTTPATSAQFLSAGPVVLDHIWRAPGVIVPDVVVPEQGGLGVMALPADADGVIRRLPLVVEAAGQLYPGLGLELLRGASGASTFILTGDPRSIMAGSFRVALPGDGLLRLIPDFASTPPHRVSAASLLAGSRPDLSGHIVLLGATAPEVGGLRQSIDDTLSPSVMIHAQAVRQMMAGLSPVVPPYATALEFGVSGATAAAGAILPVVLAPALAFAGAVFLVTILIAGAVAILAASMILLNPLMPVLAIALSFSTSALVTFASLRRQASRIRRRFEQHLSPDVVAKIAMHPEQAKLVGERREITAFFTDIENFTAFTEKAGPEPMIRVLDRYFEGIVEIILRHGGTVDKIVGDAVHAFFNAPLDLDAHADRAIACAQDVICWSETFRRDGETARLEFGRTRIGIESGEAIVGDVGVRSKLDYTAHGYAVNAAARLESANKDFGTHICIGPGTARLVSGTKLQPLGSIQLRGHSQPVSVWTVGACSGLPITQS